MKFLMNLTITIIFGLSFSIAQASKVDLKEMGKKTNKQEISKEYKLALKACKDKKVEDSELKTCIQEELAANKEVCKGSACAEDDSDPAIVGPVKKGPTGVRSFRKITKKATSDSTGVNSSDSTMGESTDEEELAEMEVFDYGEAAMEMVEGSSSMVAGTSVSPKESEMAFVPAGGDQKGVNLKPAKGKSNASDVVIAGLKKANPKAMDAIEGLYKNHGVDQAAMSPGEFENSFQQATGRAPTREEKETHAAYATARNSAEQTAPQRNLASVNKRDMSTAGLFDSSSPDAMVFVPDGEAERGRYRSGQRYQGEQSSRRVDN